MSMARIEIHKRINAVIYQMSSIGYVICNALKPFYTELTGNSPNIIKPSLGGYILGCFQVMGSHTIMDQSGCILSSLSSGLVSVVEAELHLPDEETEVALETAVVGLSPSFGVAPEVLEALDMHPAIDRGLVMIDAPVRKPLNETACNRPSSRRSRRSSPARPPEPRRCASACRMCWDGRRPCWSLGPRLLQAKTARRSTHAVLLKAHGEPVYS